MNDTPTNPMNPSISDTDPANPTQSEDLYGNPESLRYNLDSLDDYLTTCEEVAREGRLDEAVDVMREATTRYPDSPTGRYNLGVALFLRLRQDKEHLELWEDLADDEHLAEEAIGALEAAIDTDPNFVEAYNNLGRLYALRGRSEAAIETWEKSLSIKPDQPEVESDLKLFRTRISPSSEDLETRRLMEGDKAGPQI